MSEGKVNLAFVGSAALGRESIGFSFDETGLPPSLPADPAEYARPVHVYDVGNLNFTVPKSARRSDNQEAISNVLSESESKIYDVVVIGAGISGLYAARCLKREGLDVLVVEARERVGGRTITYRDPSLGYVDLGGAYYGTSQTEVLDLAKDLGLEFQTLNPAGDAIISVGGQTWTADLDEAPTKNPFILMDANYVLRTLDEMSLQVEPESPWLAEKADEWDNVTLADYITRISWFDLTAQLTKLGFSIVYGTKPEDMSLLCALQSIRTCGGTQNLFSSKVGCQKMKLKGGTSLICEKLAQELKGRIVLGQVVCTVHQYSDSVVSRTSDNKEFKSKKVVVAMSPAILKSLDFQPPIPQPQNAYLGYKAPGTIFKTFMFYDKAYWRIHGLKGEMLCDGGLVVYCVEEVKDDGVSLPALMGFLDGTTVAGLSRNERMKRVAKQYTDVFGISELSRPSHYVERTWSDNDATTFSGICVHTLPVGFLTKHKCLWGEKHQNVFFAGTEAAITYKGYMDGAVRAGEKAAKEVLDSLNKRANRVYRTDYEEVPYIPRPFLQKKAPSIKQCIVFTVVLFIIVFIIVVIAIVVRVIQSANAPTPTSRPPPG